MPPRQTARETRPDTARRTYARYGVLAFLAGLSFVLYLDRVCIGQAGTEMMKDLGLSRTQWGWVLGAFTIAYGLFEVPTGRWGDRYGSRGVLTRIVIWWSIFTALTGATANFMSLVATRFLFGAGEAGAYPNAARVVARWFPLTERDAVQGFITFSAQVGGAAAPALAAILIGMVGWRWSFAIFGLVGVAWAVAFYAWFRDEPEDHPRSSPEECRLISAGKAPERHGVAHTPIPWRAIAANRNVYLLGIVQTCGAFVAYMYMGWFPTYLKQARDVSEYPAGLMSSLVMAGGAIGCLSGGFLNRWLVQEMGSRAKAHRLYGACGLFTGAIALVVSIHWQSPWLSSFFAALACMAALSTQAAWWSVTTEISGRHLGSLFGLLNSLGTPGAFASQIFLGSFADRMARLGYEGRGQWDPAFYIYALVLVLGALLWCFIDADRRVEDGAAGRSRVDARGASS